MAGYNRGKTNDPGHSTNVADSIAVGHAVELYDDDSRLTHEHVQQHRRVTHSNLRTYRSRVQSKAVNT